MESNGSTSMARVCGGMLSLIDAVVPVFFFSSRRRHTRLQGDWSSDVCSSDLYLLGRYWQYTMDEADAQRAICSYRAALSLDPRDADTWTDLATAYESQGDTQREIGRASCRERV